MVELTHEYLQAFEHQMLEAKESGRVLDSRDRIIYKLMETIVSLQDRLHSSVGS